MIPLIVVVFFIRQHRMRKLMESFASSKMLARLQPDTSRRRPVTKMVMLSLAWGFLVVALANPQRGSKIAEGEQSGIDLAVCIDVSNSMLAQDMKPNRMERSKQVVLNLMSKLGGDRISLVVFAGSAFIEMPLTNDYGATKMFLDQIGTDMISQQGTAIGDAIDKGLSTLGYSEESDDDKPKWEPNKSRAIVVISDGENHEDDAVDAAKRAAKQGVMVCTIGIGSPQGSQIPVLDRNGNVVDLRKDFDGNIITTHLNEEMLRDIAKAGNGIYAHADNGNAAIDELVKKLSTLDESKFGAAKYSSFESQYQYPLAAGLLLLFLELFIFERRNPRINFNKMIRRRNNSAIKVTVLILMLLLSGSGMAQEQENSNAKEKTPAQKYQFENKTVPNKTSHKVAKKRRVATRTGNKELDNGNYGKALEQYAQALKADSNYSKAQYNMAYTLRKAARQRNAGDSTSLQQNAQALALYNKVCENPYATPEERAKAHYNMGNIHLNKALEAREQGGYDPQSLQSAIEQYKSALKIDSKDRNAKYNLSLAQKLVRPQQQNQNQNQNKNQQNQQNQDQKDQQNQQNKDQQNKDQQNQQNKDQKNKDQQNKDQQNQQNKDQQDKQQKDKQNGGQGDQKQDKQKQAQRREAEQMLNAMKNNEQQTMRALRMKAAKKDKQKGTPSRIEKDW